MKFPGSRLARRAARAFFIIAFSSPAFSASVNLELLSRAPDGQTAAGGSFSAYLSGISADGRFVLLGSAGPDLIPAQVDLNRAYDVFLLDRSSNGLTLLSAQSGTPRIAASGDSRPAAISRNGEFVLFSSSATDLLAGQVEATQSWGLFLLEIDSGRTQLVSHSRASSLVKLAYSSLPAGVSDSGWVLFSSDSPDLVDDDEFIDSDVFVFNPQTSAITLVSHAAGDPQRAGSSGSIPRAISADGRWVLYQSHAEDLDGLVSDTNNMQDIFLYDRVSDRSTLVSRTNKDSSGNGGSEAVAMTPDGAYVLFWSMATDLTQAVDANESSDAFLFERESGRVISISLAAGSSNETADGQSRAVGLSDDGQRILLVSDAGNMVAGLQRDTPHEEAYLLDRETGTMRLISHHQGEPLRTIGGSTPLAISSDGDRILFISHGNPFAGVVDDNHAQDLFLHDVTADSTILISSAGGSATTASGATSLAQLDAGGDVVVFTSEATDILSGVTDGNGMVDAYVYDGATARVARCVTATGTAATTTLSYSIAATGMASDGNGVLLRGSGLTTDVPPDPQGTDAYFLDRRTGSVRLLSPRRTTWPPGYSSHPAAISDGVVAIISNVPLLGDVVAEGNSEADAFVFDLQSDHQPRLVSRSIMGAGITANGRSFVRRLVDSGRLVLFDSLASDLVPGVIDTNQSSDIFVFDRDSGIMQLLSPVAGQPNVASGNAESVAISDDGRWILARAYDAGMVAGGIDDANHFVDIYLIDRQSRTTVMVSHAEDDPVRTANGASIATAMTPDGRWILYTSSAPNLVAGQSDGSTKHDVFVYDRDAGTSQMISHLPGWPTDSAESYSQAVAITDDGRFVLFESTSTGILPVIDNNNQRDVFRYDRETLSSELVSRRIGPSSLATANGGSNGRGMSADGRRVLFDSQATDLVADVQDTNRVFDTFVFDFDLERTVLVSRSYFHPGATGNKESHGQGLTADGSGVLFNSEASDLVDAVDVNRWNDAFHAQIDFSAIFSSGFELQSPLPPN